MILILCHPMRTKARIASVKSYKIYVSLSEGWHVIVMLSRSATAAVL